MPAEVPFPKALRLSPIRFINTLRKAVHMFRGMGNKGFQNGGDYMTIEAAITFVSDLLKIDPNAAIFSGDLDEFGCNAVDDTDGKRCVVWVNYAAHNCKSEHSLARFRTFEESAAFMAALETATGVRNADQLYGV